ncbi:MAG: radical SAM protein [Deltaproteobacteria bacterium]
MKTIKIDDLLIKGSKIRPFAGHLDLTYRCNLSCAHCYCKGSERAGREWTAREWKRLIDELWEHGCLQLVFSGGDPLIREDFPEIYSYAFDRGFLVSVMTNAVAFDAGYERLFRKRLPETVYVSLYGVTRPTYESITGVSGSFDKAMRAIKRMALLKLPVVLKTIGLRQNRDEVLDVKRFSERLLGKRRFQFDAFVFGRLNGDTSTFSMRLSPEEIIAIELNDPDFRVLRRKMIVGRREAFPLEYLHHCTSWNRTFLVDPFGSMHFCQLSRGSGYPLRSHGDFARYFFGVFPRMAGARFTSDSACRRCVSRPDCLFCPGRAELEGAHREGPVRYFCELTAARKKSESLFLKESLDKS